MNQEQLKKDKKNFGVKVIKKVDKEVEEVKSTVKIIRKE